MSRDVPPLEIAIGGGPEIFALREDGLRKLTGERYRAASTEKPATTVNDKGPRFEEGGTVLRDDAALEPDAKRRRKNNSRLLCRL